MRLDALWDRLLEAAERARAEAGTPGVALGLSLGDETRFAGLGTTALGGGEPITERTVFRWCSITKVVTAELVLRLDAEQPGLVEARLDEVLPGPAGDAFGELTVRTLLDHTSGLEGEWPVSLAEFGEGDDALSRFVAASPRLRRFADPGVLFGYCNPGYWLLGAIVERVAGRALEREVRERVLDPLGLTDTLTETELDRRRAGARAGFALPHRRAGSATEPVEPERMPRARFASGGLSGSARDALRFGRAIAADAGRIARVSERTAPTDRPGEGQGLGWAVDRRAGGISLGHSGFYGGFASQLQLFSGHDAVLAVLGNSDSAWSVREAVLAEASRLLLGETAAEAPVPVPAPEGFAGRYGFPGLREARLAILPGALELAAEPVAGEPFSVRAVEEAPGLYRTVGEPLPDRPLRLLDGGPGHPHAFRLGPRLGGRLGEP